MELISPDERESQPGDENTYRYNGYFIPLTFIAGVYARIFILCPKLMKMGLSGFLDPHSGNFGVMMYFMKKKSGLISGISGQGSQYKM